MLNIILLSGGSGKRLWPLSNDVRSKQFIKIFKKPDGSYESMVQRMYQSIRALDRDAKVTIATSRTQVSAIHNQLGTDVGISVEPCRRDTFPAIALAAAYTASSTQPSPKPSSSAPSTRMWAMPSWGCWRSWVPGPRKGRKIWC